MAVAATFLTVSATSAMAQADPARNSAAELAIDAAIPRPEPANVPPPTINDFKLDSAAPAADAAKADAPKAAEKAPEAKAVRRKAIRRRHRSGHRPQQGRYGQEGYGDHRPPRRLRGRRDTRRRAGQGREQRPGRGSAGRRQAARTCWARKSARYFDRKAERTAIEKFYTARDFAPLWTQGGALTATGKGVIARLKDAASDGLNPADYPVPDFAAATTPDALADADLKLTASMLDYARQAQSGRMHWSQVSGDIQYPEHPIDPTEVLTNVTTAKDASAALDSYNPPQKLYRELKAKLAELRGQGDGPVVQIADGPALKFTPARGKKQPAVAMEDPRVPQLRAKLGITENADDTHYDAKVAEAVRKFQEGADLKPTGVLDDGPSRPSTARSATSRSTP